MKERIAEFDKTVRLYCSPSRFDWWGDNCSMQALRERLPSSVGLCWKTARAR